MSKEHQKGELCRRECLHFKMVIVSEAEETKTKRYKSCRMCLNYKSIFDRVSHERSSWEQRQSSDGNQK